MSDVVTPRFACRMEHVCGYSAELQPPEVIGPVPEGIRVNFHIKGGPIVGPKLRGRLLAIGMDAFLIRRDGIGQLDVHSSIETDDGALIDIRYDGLGDIGADGYERFMRGDLPATLALRTLPRMRTAHPDYEWLHRSLFVGIGEVDLQKSVVRYDVYRVA